MAWKRAFERSPCPICGHLRYCTASDDGKVVNCTRTPNDRPIPNRKTGEVIGYLHRINENAAKAVRALPGKAAAPKLSRAEVELTHRQHRTAVNPHRLKVHAKQLGVTSDALQALHIGWDADRQAWTFPMVDADGKINGLRYRRDDGAKWSLAGGTEGVFMPEPLNRRGPLIICEGPSSAAGWLDLGFDVIGRPSCASGTAILVDVARRMNRPWLIVADRDSRKQRPDKTFYYPGPDGARALYETLLGVCPVAWAVCPVPKDGRDWLKRGATRAIVDEWINKHVGRDMLSISPNVRNSA